MTLLFLTLRESLIEILARNSALPVGKMCGNQQLNIRRCNNGTVKWSSGTSTRAVPDERLIRWLVVTENLI